MKSLVTFFLGVLLITGVSGCASMTTGHKKNIAIHTTPEVGASCKVSNANGSWDINQTPATVEVARDNSNIVVACQKNQLHGEVKVKYSPEPTAFGNVVMIGGVIGAAIDYKTGAAFTYPNTIIVPISTEGTFIDATNKEVVSQTELSDTRS